MKNKSKSIIDSIRSGENQKALKHLYKGPLNKIRRYILNNSGTIDDADDVFQDAVVTLFHYVKTGQYKSEYDLDGFLFRVAKNAWIDKNRNKNNAANEAVKDEYASSDHDYLGDLIKEEKLKIFHQLFDKLEDNCKKLLTYIVYDKKSLKEVAELMGFKDTNVAKNQHYRCKKYFSKIVFQHKEALKLLKD